MRLLQNRFVVLLLSLILLSLVGCTPKQDTDTPPEKPADIQVDKAPGKAVDTPADKASAKTVAKTVAASADKAADKPTLTIYSGRKEKLIGPVFALFEAEAGVKVRVKYAATQSLATALVKEGERTNVDIFIAQDASTLGFLEARQGLAPLPKGLAETIVPTFRSASEHWVPITGRARVLAYNSNKLKPEDLPKSVDELTDPKWKGRIGWPPQNASFKSFLVAMLSLRGEEKTKSWLSGVQANAPKAYPKNTPAVRAVGKGEVDVALVNHYYLYRLRKELGDDFPVTNHYFKDGTAAALVNISGAAVVKHTKKPDLAAKFLRFLLSPKAQTFFADNNYEFPLVAGIKPSIGLPAVDTLNPPKVDLTKLDNLETTEKLLRDTGALP